MSGHAEAAQEVTPLPQPRLRELIGTLGDERALMLAALNGLPYGVVIHDSHGAVMHCNVAACQALRLDVTQVRGSRPPPSSWRLYPQVAHMATVDALRDAESVREVGVLFSDEHFTSRTMAVCGLDGEAHWLSVSHHALAWQRADGNLEHGGLLCLSDESRLVADSKLLGITVEAARIGLWEWSVGTGYVRRNDMCWTLLGMAPQMDRATLQDWIGGVDSRDQDAFNTALHTSARTGRVLEHECRFVAADGQIRWLQTIGRAIERDDSGVPTKIVGVQTDVTERKRLELALEKAAFVDALTGLPNRAAMRAWLQEALARLTWEVGKFVCVYFLDFDRFKLINDSMGHAVGDELLREIAERLRKTLRLSDPIARFCESADTHHSSAMRLGGDEFVVVAEGLGGDLEAQALAQRLLDVLGRPYALSAGNVHSSVSIGLVCVDQDSLNGRSVDDVLRDADTAMYEAKRAGRARYALFTPQMMVSAQRSHMLDAQLRQVLEDPRKRGLRVVYQPIVDLNDGSLYGFEALLRWNHSGQEISPVEFVAIAEENGLIDRLGEFVLDAACAAMRRWLDADPQEAPAVISVNVSRKQIIRGDLHEVVARVLNRHGLGSERLHLEITESVVATVDSLSPLQLLRNLGVRISMDDFGTGYSSLSMLAKLPIDTVKFDRTFLSDIANSVHQRCIVQASSQVANVLSLNVVAEGVEAEGHVQLLREIGCRYGQGYFFSRPLEALFADRWARGERGAAGSSAFAALEAA